MSDDMLLCCVPDPVSVAEVRNFTEIVQLVPALSTLLRPSQPESCSRF